jgi:hypothetical protein
MHKFSSILIALILLLSALGSAAADRTCCDVDDCPFVQCVNMGCASHQEPAAPTLTHDKSMNVTRDIWISLPMIVLPQSMIQIWTPPD